MNTLVEHLNSCGDYGLRLAWPMFWQSSLLIGLLLGLEWALRRRVRAAVRYGLWLLVLLKLLLPPSLAMPTGLGWWLRPAASLPAKSRSTAVMVTYGPAMTASIASAATTHSVQPPRPHLSSAAGALLGSALVSLGFLGWIVVRWRQATRETQSAAPAPEWLDGLLQEAREALGVRRRVRLRVIDQAVSPAVCGLVWPVVLLPRSLAERLPHGQLRAVLLHELAHLRRGDVWTNCAQALLQVVYWWHPLLWLANARIRRVREEAVDDAVMIALREEADSYAPTLLEVAKLALQRPLASLGLVGILESHSSLRQRIERLLEFRPPRKAGLTLASALCVLAFGALALPMGEGPSRTLVTPAGTKANEHAPLLVRTFKVDITNFLAAIEQPAGPVQPTAPKLPSESFRAWFQGLGVDLAPPKSLFYKDRLGWLYVRATAQDLDTIEAAIHALNTAPEQVHIKAQFSAVPESSLDKLQRILGTGGTNGVRVLTRDESVEALRIIRAGPDNTDSIESSVTTESGRQTQIRAPAMEKANSPKVAGSTMVHEGMLLFSQGKLDEAQEVLRKAYKEDPQDQVTRHYLNLLAEARFKAKSAEAARNDTNALGFDWYLGNFLKKGPEQARAAAQEVVHTVNATSPESPATVPPANTPLPQIAIHARFCEVPEEAAAKVWSSLGREVGSTNLTSILTPAQTTALIKTIEADPRTDLLSTPSVVTLSGRRAQIQCSALCTVVTNINPQAFEPPGVSTSGNPGGLLLLTTQFASGPKLDVLPSIAGAGWSIQLSTTSTLAEFLGYGPPGEPLTVYVDGKKGKTARPLPQFRVRSMVNCATVWDGQTLLLGGTTAEDIKILKDKVPILGDIPLLGHLFRSQSSFTEKKQLLVFLTPNLVDPAGNRVHTDEQVDQARGDQAK